jgi:VIT1/CCC1 family predicted Fe2+/Mn2+ transporter
MLKQAIEITLTINNINRILSVVRDESLLDALSCLITGIAYILTVTVFITPYLVLENYYLCLIVTLVTTILIFALFNYYISVAKDAPFRKRSPEVAALSLGIALFSFIHGYFIRTALSVEV